MTCKSLLAVQLLVAGAYLIVPTPAPDLADEQPTVTVPLTAVEQDAAALLEMRKS